MKYFPCEQWLANTQIALGNETRLFGWDEDPTELSSRITYKVLLPTPKDPQDLKNSENN